MKTKKKIIISALLALFFITNVCSASSGQNATGGRLADKVKFGLGFGKGFTAGSPFAAALEDHPSGEYLFLDLFGEYKFSNEYGLRLSIQPTSSSSLLAYGTSLDVGYYSVGFTNRVYVGQDKQLCLFFGIETRILSSAKEKYKNFFGKNVELDLRKKEDLEQARGPESGLNEVRSSLKFGWDYECENGLIIGGVFTSAWASEDKDNDSTKKIEVLPLNAQQLFYLGYNFAKLFD